ncbi:hypothetical protein IP90_02076 [Luteimonas cucumeris]|uniref:Methyltransferase family protein n=1 Tax=Luteimonas cucumeris TaxID=985012 RepID=A0A562L6A4_9GAMM|nr:hypothetical protein [Luteimonas cucumeris]TWI02974.1 hypothetical protein IP90_02076 [Luteimonas cucumeris]
MTDNAEVTAGDKAAKYWEARKDLVYYQVVRIIVAGMSCDTRTMLDVGSGNCPYLEWFPQVPERTSLDMRSPYMSDSVQGVKANFLAWTPKERFGLVSCLQVLEHVPDATAFAQKLLDVSDALVISVPYRWPFGKTKSHVQDPVDEEKLFAWFKREPNYQYLCQEISADVKRLVQVYDRFPEKWNSLSQRDALLRRFRANGQQ